MKSRLAHAVGHILDVYVLGGYTYKEEQRGKWNEAIADATRRLDETLEKDRAV